MGMSASQARMLSLTTRLSDLEYQAQSISNSKIRLADQSTSASQKYQDALNKEKLTVMTGYNTNIDATAYNLTTYNAVSTTDKQRFITDATGRVLVSSSVGSLYDTSQNVGSTSYSLKQTYSSNSAYLTAALGYSNETEAAAAGRDYDANKVAYYTNRYSGAEQFLRGLGYTSNVSNTSASYTYDAAAVDYYLNVFNQIAENGYNSPGDGRMKDSEWLYSELSAGNLYIEEWNTSGGEDGSGGWEQISWSSGDASLQTESDESDVAKAEAEYETAMATIKSQDNKYDLQLKQIETQHSAVQTEIESVRKVIDKNIDRTFKLFDA